MKEKRDKNNNFRSVSTVDERKHIDKESLKISVKGSAQPTRQVIQEGGKSDKIKITVYNKKKKPIESPYDDPELSSGVDKLNQELYNINKCKVPRLARDILYPHKKATCRRTKYRKNFGLFHDGIHHIRDLSKLWACRILKFAEEINANF